MKRNELIVHVTLVLIFTAALLLVAALLVGSGYAESQRASPVGLYMKEPGDYPARVVRAYGDDETEFKLKLENYNGTDIQERSVLLYALPNVKYGYEENWDYEFPDAVMGGLPYVTADHPDFGTVDFYKYNVEADGTPTDVTFEVAHDYENPFDNEDDIEYRIYGLDYEANDEPTVPYENLTLQESIERFFHKIIERDWGTNHNITYLLDDGETPNIEYSNVQELRVFVVPTPLDPMIYAEPSISVSAGSTYKLMVTVVNEGGQEDQLSFFAEMVGDTKDHWNIQAEDYVFGDLIALGDSGGQRKINLSINASLDREDLPEGMYQLELRAVSETDPMFNHTTEVTIELLQRYDPLINLSSLDTDDKVVYTDGNSTRFSFALTNNGTLPDTITITAEVGNMLARGGITDPHWTKEFYPSGNVVVGPNETVSLSVNLTPALDNWKIMPGTYPVHINVSSKSNGNRTNGTMDHLRMPDLHNLALTDLTAYPVGMMPGREGMFGFTVTNGGVVDDTMTLGFWIEDQGGTIVSSDEFPGEWDYAFEDADTGATFDFNRVTLAPGSSRHVLLKLTPPVGTSPGTYDIEITVASGGPTGETRNLTASFAVTLPDLWIESTDIEITPDDVEEDDEVKIRATVHLGGAIEVPIKVEFFYHTAASGFVYIGEVDLDFGGKSGADVTETVELKWKARVPYAVENNIKVMMDATDVVEESDETNNEAVTTIVVVEVFDPPPPPPDPPIVSYFLVSVIMVILVVLAAVVRMPSEYFEPGVGVPSPATIEEKKKEDEAARTNNTKQTDLCPHCGGRFGVGTLKKSVRFNCHFCGKEIEFK